MRDAMHDKGIALAPSIKPMYTWKLNCDGNKQFETSLVRDCREHKFSLSLEGNCFDNFVNDFIPYSCTPNRSTCPLKDPFENWNVIDI